MRITSLILAGALLAAAASSTVYARAGGGVSVGRSSASVARSTPAVSRPSFPAPAPRPTFTMPAPPRYTLPTPRTEPSRASTGAGSAFVGGLAGAAVGTMVGNALSGPDVVVAPGAGAAPATPGGAPTTTAGGTTIIEQPLIGAGGLLLLLAAGAGGIYWWSRRRNQSIAAYRGHVPPRPVPLRPEVDGPRPADMDPIVLFYAVQQAAMDDDRHALDRYCGQGLAMLLSGQPEPGRVATKTLTGLTWTRPSDDAIRFSFRDQVAGLDVTEVWLFDDAGRLDGIEVL